MMKILLVEKNDVMIEIVTDLLTTQGYAVTTFLPQNGDMGFPPPAQQGNALDLVAQASEYDAVIVDRETWGMDGILFRDILTRLCRKYEGKIVATTTLAHLADGERTEFGDRVHWLNKPYRMSQLEAVLKNTS